MNREKARAALDDAFADSVKPLFNVLEIGLLDDSSDAADKFRNGMEARIRAYDIGVNVIETIFPA